MVMALRGQFSSNIIFELTMNGLLRKSEKPPTLDIWGSHVELNHRQFQSPKYGQLFLKDDRALAKTNVGKIIEMHLLPHIAGKLIITE
jgi:hypothetical protein